MRLRKLGILFSLVLLGTVFCVADSISFVGSLPDPNSVVLLPFTVTESSTVTVQSWGYGGGTNAEGATIASGGFIPDLSVFGPAPTYSVLADTNFMYSCPPGNLDSNGLCGDSTLSLLLNPGDYAVAVVAAPNFPLGIDLFQCTDLADCFNGGGSLTGNYGEDRTGYYAVDVIMTPSVVPEPGALSLLASGVLIMAGLRRRIGK